MQADASYNKSHWFESQGDSVHDTHPSEIAVLLAAEEEGTNAGRAAGGGSRGLARKEAERALASGVTPDSEILHGPVKHVAARVNSIIGKYTEICSCLSKKAKKLMNITLLNAAV